MRSLRLLHVLFVFLILCQNDQAAPEETVTETGLIFADEGRYRSIPLATAPLMGNLPENVDMSGMFPEAGNQGHEGSCVGWAVAYGLKSFQEREQRKWDLRNSAHLFSPAYIYNQIRQGSDCLGGCSYIEALDLLTSQGVATLADFPYSAGDCDKKPDALTRQKAQAFRIATWRRVNPQDSSEVKAHLASGFPILIGMVVDASFQALRGDQVYAGPNGNSLGGHAMVVIGYSQSKGAFKVLNSWSSAWGDRGYGWIAYDSFRRLVREAYVTQNIIVTPPEVSPTPSISTTPGPSPTATAPPPIVQNRPTVVYNVPTLLFNVPMGNALGIQINVPGRVTNGAGHTVQLVARFSNTPDMTQMLPANPQEFKFRDTTGFVATGTQQMPIPVQDFDLFSLPIYIPYYALNFQSSNGVLNHFVYVSVTVYIDNFQAGQTAPVLFQVRF